MVNSPQYHSIEKRFGRPMRDVLVTLLSHYQRERVAVMLGINPNTLDRYLSANSLRSEPLRANVVKVIQTGAPATPAPASAAKAILAKATAVAP
jgi:hypothetical protein